MKGPTPSQIKAALKEAKEIGALRVRIDGEGIDIILAAEKAPEDEFRFDHEDHDEAA